MKETLDSINSQMKQYEKYIKPSMDLRKIPLKDGVSLVGRNLVAEFHLTLISAEFKPGNKTKHIVLVFTDIVAVLKKRYRGYELYTSMDINSSMRILALPSLKYYPH